MKLSTQPANHVDGEEWDEFLLNSPYGHHVQTIEWANLKAKLGWEFVRLVIRERKKIIAGAQVLIRHIPIYGQVAYITKGPVCAECNPVIGARITDQITSFFHSERIRYMAVQPPGRSEFLQQVLSDAHFSPGSLEITPSASIMMDLSQGLDNLMKGMSKETRARVKLSQKSNWILKEGNRSDLETFYQLYLSTAKRQKFSPYSMNYFTQLWDLFAPKKWISLIMVYYGETAVCGQLLVPFGDTVIAKKMGWSGEFTKLRPNDALFWGAIVWSAEHGYHYFDFEGIDPEGARIIQTGGKIPNGTKLAKDTIKYGFGGEIVFFPRTYDLVSDRFQNWMYRHTQSILNQNGLVSQFVDTVRNK